MEGTHFMKTVTEIMRPVFVWKTTKKGGCIIFPVATPRRRKVKKVCRRRLITGTVICTIRDL